MAEKLNAPDAPDAPNAPNAPDVDNCRRLIDHYVELTEENSKLKTRIIGICLKLGDAMEAGTKSNLIFIEEKAKLQDEIMRLRRELRKLKCPTPEPDL